MSDPDPHHTPQFSSPTYRLASLDQDFIMGPSMRGVRFLLEFAKPDEALRSWGVRSTIVVFGSARFSPASGTPDHKRWYADALVNNGRPGARRWRQVWSDHRRKADAPAAVSRAARPLSVEPQIQNAAA